MKKKIDPMFYNNDSSIDNEPVRDTVINDDNKFGVICDRSDDANPLPILPESPPYNIIMPCIYSTHITNDGGILLLALFCSVYQVHLKG